jgi:BolA protein
MSIREQIQQQLQPLLHTSVSAAVELVVEDESFRHGRTDSHFKVVAVSDIFASMSRLERHRWLYQQLDPWLKAGVHALALHLYTPAEWSKVTGTDSPLCRGGE